MIRVRLNVGDHCIAQSDVDETHFDFSRWGHTILNLHPLHPYSDAVIQIDLQELAEDGTAR